MYGPPCSVHFSYAANGRVIWLEAGINEQPLTSPEKQPTQPPPVPHTSLRAELPPPWLPSSLASDGCWRRLAPGT